MQNANGTDQGGAIRAGTKRDLDQRHPLDFSPQRRLGEDRNTRSVLDRLFDILDAVEFGDDSHLGIVTAEEAIDLFPHREAAVEADERLTSEVAGLQIACRSA